MLFLSIMHDYALWHYTRAFKELFHVWLNFLWFGIHYFSIPQLLKSWFSPFKRIVEERRRGVSFEDIAGYIVINLLSRMIGAVLRSFLIITGLLFVTIIIIIGALVHVLWVFIPLLLIAGLVGSISLFLL